MAKEMFTMVAGGALEADTVFNLRCNCGGNAPVTPTSVVGFGYSKKGGPTRSVGKLEGLCERCGTTIKAMVLEGDPGYVLTIQDGKDVLFLPQGSTSVPVSQLSPEERAEILAQLKEHRGE
jgi:hypothetical protein